LAVREGVRVIATSLRRGTVVSVDEVHHDFAVLTVGPCDDSSLTDGLQATVKACAYPGIAATPRPGDSVIVNTVGLDLGLGTGGFGFVLVNLSAPLPRHAGSGHIVKLRYTPLQLTVLSVEEEGSPYHDLLSEPALTLEGAPVVSAELHSALPAIAAGVKAYDPSLPVCYVMTDGGALPIAFSRTVRELKERGLVQAAVTAGHAFGGDYEAVNVFSGLLAAKHVAHAGVIVVSKGPGIAGTGTPLGHTGMEQGEALNAAYRLGGTAVLTPRFSDTDDRERHSGLSHHFDSVLRFCVYCPTYIPVPLEIPLVSSELASRLTALGVSRQHRIVESPGEPGLRLLAQLGVPASTMGRSLDEDRAYFATASAAGWFAARAARGGVESLPEPGVCWRPNAFDR
jgi:hypothetical protein